jgi:hypothetical protein
MITSICMHRQFERGEKSLFVFFFTGRPQRD